jgi:hypothetical protein
MPSAAGSCVRTRIPKLHHTLHTGGATSCVRLLAEATVKMYARNMLAGLARWQYEKLLTCAEDNRQRCVRAWAEVQYKMDAAAHDERS